MRCHHCGHTFPANYRATYPGGYESPRTFLVLGVIFAAAGIAVQLTVGSYWKWFLYGIAGFVWLQCIDSLVTCWRIPCPNCKQPTKVRPWSS
jgi:hypothetical protein